MRTPSSRPFGFLAAIVILTSTFLPFTGDSQPLDYALLPTGEPAPHFALSLAMPLLVAGTAAILALAIRSRRMARYAALITVGSCAHWVLLDSPLYHATLPTGVGVGVWFALTGAAIIAIVSVLPDPAMGTEAYDRYGPVHGDSSNMGPQARLAAARTTAARPTGSANSIARTFAMFGDRNQPRP